MQYLCKELYFLHEGTIDLRRTIYRCNAHNLYIVNERSIDRKQTIYRWETNHLYSLHRPSVFLLLELYIFMYNAINQQNVDFRSFLSVRPYIGTEISHSRYA